MSRGGAAGAGGLFNIAPLPFVDFPALAGKSAHVHARTAEESGSTSQTAGRRRRSNRPGTSQANGPQFDGTLESSRRKRRLTEGVRRVSRRNLSGPVTEGASSRTAGAGRKLYLWDVR